MKKTDEGVRQEAVGEVGGINGGNALKRKENKTRQSISTIPQEEYMTHPQLKTVVKQPE